MPGERQGESAAAHKIVVHLELDCLPLADAIHVFEERYIHLLLSANHGHKGRTSAMLGIDRKTLYRKLKHGMPGTP